jgi:small subunit ribosomal protein S1
MKNLYSLTPKHLAAIQRETHAQPTPPPAQPPAPPQRSAQPPAQPQRPARSSAHPRPVRSPEGRPQFEPASPVSQPEEWWSAVMDEEGAERPAAPAEPRAPAPERPAAASYDWSAARELYESDGIAELYVTGVNRGGLLVEGSQIRGFIPLSHLIGVPSLTSEEERQAAMHLRVGAAVKAKIIEFDPEKGRVVFSERAAQAAPGRRAELLAQLKVGDRIPGEVTNITNFGVFIDLGGMEGLVHLSEISWGRVHNPADFVTIGRKVDVEVISVDREQGRVALSLKRLLPDPWVSVPERYVPGMWVPCTVTYVTNFGAFASLEEGVEGLIHISELADGGTAHPHDVVSIGDELTARVISVNVPTRRLALSLRRVDSAPAAGDPEADAGPMELEPESGG